MVCSHTCILHVLLGGADSERRYESVTGMLGNLSGISIARDGVMENAIMFKATAC